MPRKTLREPACREFEQALAEAIERGQSTVDPKQYGWSQVTLVQRLGDAKNGFLRYGYQFKANPEMLRWLKVHEMSDGTVMIKHHGMVAQPTRQERLERLTSRLRELEQKGLQGTTVYQALEQEQEGLLLELVKDGRVD